MKALFLLVAISFATALKAQYYETVVHNGDSVEIFNPIGSSDEDTTIITNKDGTTTKVVYVGKMPYPNYSLDSFYAKNLQYPQDAKDLNVCGLAIVLFLVTKDGNIDSAQVTFSVYPSIGKEGLRLVNTMPPWQPAVRRDKKVDAWYRLQIPFRLP